MMIAPLIQNEAERLGALRSLDVLDSDVEAEFDALVCAAALACDRPIALMSLIDADRQWFKANTGLPGIKGTPRDVAFCAHAIVEPGLFEVPDATLDPRFAGNPLVLGEPTVRFYAGAPVTLDGGLRVGTLCVIDRKPGCLSAAQRELLACLSIAAAKALQRRQSARELNRMLAAMQTNEARSGQSGSLAGHRTARVEQAWPLDGCALLC